MRCLQATIISAAIGYASAFTVSPHGGIQSTTPFSRTLCSTEMAEDGHDLTIEYCSGSFRMMRAARFGQKVQDTFADNIKSVTLVPAEPPVKGGLVTVSLDGTVLWDGSFPEVTEVKSLVRDQILNPKAPDISPAEIKGLFNLWNDALATLDPDTVAKRYSKNAVLLPTVSDTPRASYDTIKDYFVNFLKNKPQGVILESNTVKGNDYALDAGIYEFTMGASGAVVRARYTFQYVYEDGEWKIVHHHSSVMPESIPKAEPITDDEVRGLFSLWNNALATLDPDAVAKRYAKNAVLLPTVSDTPRTSYYLIRDYFVNFLQKKPQGVILESNVLQGFNWAMDAGIYEFTLGATGDKVKARYSFQYVFEDGEWKISHHHSSVMPESIPSAEPITDDEVRGLFKLWNDALATLDSDKVAKRYSKDAVLLPTVSDTPRTNYYLIKDYFDNFLQKKPQGVILESNVLRGHNWAQDAGIYEFTLGATGDKVKARYTYVYVFEDGEWKISHHHSSMMPEQFL